MRIAKNKGWVSTADLTAACSVSRHTAHKDLVALVAAGKLEVQGQGNATYYSLSELTEKGQG